jgi:hypothetical protein
MAKQGIFLHSCSSVPLASLTSVIDFLYKLNLHAQQRHTKVDYSPEQTDNRQWVVKASCGLFFAYSAAAPLIQSPDVYASHTFEATSSARRTKQGAMRDVAHKVWHAITKYDKEVEKSLLEG